MKQPRVEVGRYYLLAGGHVTYCYYINRVPVAGNIEQIIDYCRWRKQKITYVTLDVFATFEN